jgi:hypothetical protein
LELNFRKTTKAIQEEKRRLDQKAAMLGNVLHAINGAGDDVGESTPTRKHRR